MSENVPVLETVEYLRSITIGTAFRQHLESAIARFCYLHPDVHVSMGEEVVLKAFAPEKLEEAVRDFTFVLYRQKIYAETLGMRQILLKRLLSQ